MKKEAQDVLSIRDQIAIAAMQSLTVQAITDHQDPEDVAIVCYMFADRMMEARKESK